MSDDSTKEGVDAPELKPDGEGEQKKTYSEDYVKKLFAERDNVKSKLREYEAERRKAEEAKMIEDGRLKELLAAKENELKELSVLRDEVEVYRAVEAKRKESLLEKFPESDRELFSGLSSAQLEVLVSKLAPAEEPTSMAKPGGAKPTGDFDSMSNADKLKMKLENPSLYRAKYTDWYKKKTGRTPPFDPIQR